MAWRLFRLGRWSFQHRKFVSLGWFLALCAILLGSLLVPSRTNDNFELSGIESTDAFELIEQRTPGASADGAAARIVFEVPAGESLTDAPHKRTVGAALARLDGADVQTVADPYAAGTLSADGRVGYATVTFTESPADLAGEDRGRLEDVRTTAEGRGLDVVIGGDALAPEAHSPVAELVGIGVAFLVLALTLGSLLAAGMPLLTALVGVGIGMSAISVLAMFVELSSLTGSLGTMLGLAVGIDYALFIMTRYRTEVRAGRPRDEAAGVAVGTAGSAVVFAGLTVIVALVGLSLSGIGFLTQMGLGGAFTIALSVFIALTLLPALLGFAGPRVAPYRAPTGARPRPAKKRATARLWAEAVVRLKWPVTLVGTAAAAVVSIPALSIQLSLPDDSTGTAGSDARVAYDLISEHFGPGANGPLVVVVDTRGTTSATAARAAVALATERIDSLAAASGSGVAGVIPAVSDDTPESQQVLAQRLEMSDIATLTVIPATGPAQQETKELVTDIRDALGDLEAASGARALVTGQTAVGIDISTALRNVFPVYLSVVVGLAVLLLVAVFRSIWVPIKAALGFLLSVGVSLGATVAVFQWGWFNELVGIDVSTPVLFILPILLTGILFGLAMDYEVFLVTRMREAHVRGTPAVRAIVDGFAHSGRVVAAAAVIMVGVFAGFVLTDDIILKTIGFALAIGVLADAFLVRMLIVPAVMAIVGERIWWMPKAMSRAVPSFDIEGEQLARRLEEQAASGSTRPTVRVPAG
ncbi:MMPL family transporter [Streptomyces sp. NPDC059134]|uniref:MMPL family transporter n=1 Tax=Streptomyces sp. NPDC059134 TaxID=3346738 RepID=UPI0036D07612